MSEPHEIPITGPDGTAMGCDGRRHVEIVYDDDPRHPKYRPPVRTEFPERDAKAKTAPRKRIRKPKVSLKRRRRGMPTEAEARKALERAAWESSHGIRPRLRFPKG